MTERRPSGALRRRIATYVAIAVVALTAVVSQVVLTQASWNDQLSYATPMSAGTWQVVSPIAIRDGGISAGNAATQIANIAWPDVRPSAFCTTVSFTGTSSTREHWQVKVDLDQVPFRGLRADQVRVQRGVKVAGPDNTLLITGVANNDPNAPFDVWSNNTPISNTQTALVDICMDWNAQPQGDPDWYTTTLTPGTGGEWTDTRACMTLQVATTQRDLAANPFFYHWTATLDMSSAFARLAAAGNVATRVEWPLVQPDRDKLTSNPSPDAPPSASYQLVSGTTTALRATGSGHEVATVTACALVE